MHVKLHVMDLCTSIMSYSVLMVMNGNKEGST